MLDLDTRRRIFDYVTSYPGLHLREIARGVELEPNHVKYHLRYLEQRDLVSSRRADGYWRFWARVEGETGMRDPMGGHEKTLLSFCRRAVPLRIVVFLLGHNEAALQAFAAETGLSHSTVHYHLSKMECAGLLQSRKDGRERLFRLADPETTRRILADYRPPDSLVQGFLEAWEELEL